MVNPSNVVNCVQKILGPTSKCLGCVCDIVKAVIPVVNCKSGDFGGISGSAGFDLRSLVGIDLQSKIEAGLSANGVSVSYYV